MKQMEVMVPVQDQDFSFDSASSVPVSPQGFENYFFSAPTSPLHQTSNYNYKQDFCDDLGDDKAFAFSICGDLDFPPLCSADELFESGKIKFCELSRKKIIQNTLSFGGNNKVCSDHFTNSRDDAKDSSLSGSSSVGWLRKKWRLKDLLARKVGHETNKEEDLKNSSAKKKKKKKKNERAVVALSAHERHYKVKRAATEEMRKRSYLPYRQNLMIGCTDVSAVIR